MWTGSIARKCGGSPSVHVQPPPPSAGIAPWFDFGANSCKLAPDSLSQALPTVPRKHIKVSAFHE